MGRNQHSKDRMHITPSEWKYEWGGHKDDTESRLLRAKFRRLPFSHCALSFVPFDAPVCTPKGTQFELTQIVPFLHKSVTTPAHSDLYCLECKALRHGVDPVSGTPLRASDLIHLKYAKDAAGLPHCPVTYKVFTPTSRIVAVRTTGNVYSHEAVHTLNVKADMWRDLMDDTPFTADDIITLQDPTDLDKYNIDSFFHVKMKLKKDKPSEDGQGEGASSSAASTLRRPNAETRDTLKALEGYKVDKLTAEIAASSSGNLEAGPEADEISAAHFSTGRLAAGLTSTVMQPLTQQKAAVRDERTLKYERVKKKGYVRMVTNFGPLNLELHCDLAPMACDNFIQLCNRGYYNNTTFHRLIKHFMIQGGDPTGTGTGGESAFGAAFADEFAPQLSHSSRGVLSMANSGTATNTSQFFITLRQCTHLDRKHTIFGRLVGGMETLTAVERLPVDDDDRPLQQVLVMATQVFVDPFEQAEQQLEADRVKLRKRKAEEAAAGAAGGGGRANEGSDPSPAQPAVQRSGVGKYIKRSGAATGASSLQRGLPPPPASTDALVAAAAESAAPHKKTNRAAPRPAAKLSDFSAW